MRGPTTVVLKVLLTLLLLAALVGQVYVIPALAGEVAWENPGVAWLQAPLTVLAVLFLVCVELAFVATWALLTMAGRDAIFAPSAFRWVDAILWAIAAACVLVAGTGVFLLVVGVWAPGLTLVWPVTLIIGVALGLLVVVMRGLLRKAMRLEQDLAEVV